ncbi:septum site-determining minD homolog, chloroplastic [Olea europaea subsp. europaea]|uniref:Septum site-determining minD homolog, chloroplastic n=1 Tax=Olea europaea subsp. europaea TaxID=158383 RepID=A0A8S0S0Z0_OLEEU|nr:septum site-determining minD homolog, chloroplastic [Olea europaea subsp. europaea]
MTGWVNRFAHAGDSAVEIAESTAYRFRQAKTEIVTASRVAYQFLAGVASNNSLLNAESQNRGRSPRFQASWFKNLISSGANPSTSSEMENQDEETTQQQQRLDAEALLRQNSRLDSLLQYNRKPQLAGETPRVVVITSGKGGVGKTTTTANIGLSLARIGFSIVAIDADVGLRNLDLLLGLENRVNYTVVEVLNGDCRLDQALVRDKRWSNFELLCISKPRSKLPLGFGGKALIWLVEALKAREEGVPDFIIIDCPAGIDAGFITAITPANEAVLVTTPDITSLRDADRVTGLLECDGIRDINMIVNRVRTDMIKGEDMMSVLDVQEMLGLPLLGVIPEDTEVIRSTNRGYPLVLNKPPALAGLAFEQAAWRLVEQDSMKAVMMEEEPKKRGFFSFFGG